MAQQEQTTFVIKAIEQGFDKVINKLEKQNVAQEKVGKSAQKAGVQFDKYGRRMRGAADMSSNATKNFSKMQQNMDGGGSGGLVRAYALLAANVFALSAAFGILSRSAQIDTLTQSMEQLEVVSGRSIRSVARDLQEASGFGMDFAASLRSTSLALSAGFETKQILELGQVARNAAVSLGRNVPDALDRIFRGVIKVEPELLDEIGLFVRVNEAASKYASQLGVAVGDLTEFQRRQAFANEAISQGQEKFASFESVQIDPFSELATTFSDMTQDIMSFINKGIVPLVSILSENKVLFGQLFLIIGMQLTKMVVPAIGQFTLGIAANAEAAREAAAESQEQSQMKIMQLREEQQQLDIINLKIRERQAAELRFNKVPQQLKVRGRDASKQLEVALQDQQVIGAQRLVLVEQRITDLTKERGLTQRMKNADTREELRLLEAEAAVLREQVALDAKLSFVGPMPAAQPKKGELADLVQLQKQKDVIKAEALATVTATAEFEGMGKGFEALNTQMDMTQKKAELAGIKFSFFDKVLMKVGGTAAIVGVKFQKMMMALGPLITIIMIAIPLLTGLLKLFGFFSKEAEEVKKANQAAAEAFGTLSKKVNHALKQLEKFRADDNFKGINDSLLALKESTLASAQALDKQIDALDHYRNETGILVESINATFAFIFGGTAQQKINRNARALIKNIEDNDIRISKSTQDIIDLFKDKDAILGTAFVDTDISKQLVESFEKDVESFKSAKSSIDGARDSAREFADSLITKSAVDKPLSTFKQITASIGNSNLQLEDQISLLKEVVRDQAVMTLLTQDQRDLLKDSEQFLDNGSIKETLTVLEGIELAYARQQELLLRQKQELERIKKLNQDIGKVTKFSEGAIQLNAFYLNEQKILEKEILQQEINRKITATGLTQERLRYLGTVGSIVGREKELGIELENVAQVQEGIRAVRELQIFEMNEEFRLATQNLEVLKAQMEVRQRLLQIVVDSNKQDIIKNQQDARLDAFNTRGSTSLLASESFQLLVDEQKIKDKTRKQEEELKKAIVGLEYDIITEQLKVLERREELLFREEQAQRNIPINDEIKRLESVMSLDGSLGRSREEMRAYWEDQMPGWIAEYDRLVAERDKDFVSSFTDDMDNITAAKGEALKIISKEFQNNVDASVLKLAQTVEKELKGSTAGQESMEMLNQLSLFEKAYNLVGEDGKPIFDREMLQLKLFETQLLTFAENLKGMFGDEGALPAALGTASANILNIFTTVSDALNDDKGPLHAVSAIATAISASLGQISSVFSAYMQNQVSQIDSLIDAEKKRDGKSKESLEKLRALEAKKDKMKRKEFETNKKIMLAQAVASTAAGVAGALAIKTPYELPIAAAVAGMIGAMGAVQIALISKLKYNSAPTSVEKPNTNLSIGKRSSAVDIARGPTAGELNYLRGGRTDGTNLGGAGASLPGAAMGRKGYSMGGEGVIVGERGPEIITPSVPVDITPNFALGGQPTNVNFTINAVDAAGVEDVLMNQRGNLIRMIREAANENGERFLETVDTQSYGSNK